MSNARALADFHRRGGWQELGDSSLFCLLHRQLGLAKSAANRDTTVMALPGRPLLRPAARVVHGDDLMDRFAREAPRASEPVAA